MPRPKAALTTLYCYFVLEKAASASCRLMKFKANEQTKQDKRTNERVRELNGLCLEWFSDHARFRV
ncbi:hypothetical protein N9D57_04340 [bacterium]|nr:hypothetical protein [bacterium]